MEKNYPLLQSQIGIFMEWMADPSITRYNLPMIVPFSKKVSLEKLAQAFQRLFDARPVLRTCFVLDSEGMPRQYSNPDMVIPIVQKQMTEEEVKRYIEQDFVRPYDLLCGEPLCRIELVSTEEKNYVLFEIHHIIADGMTLAPNLTINDLPAAYNGEPLAETDYGMYEAAEEEQASLHTEAYERSKAWYAERFGGQEFTTFAHRTANPLGNSIHEDEYLDQTLLDNWCQQQGTSVNLLLMAAFSYVLSEASREEQVIYRTINHGRMDKRLLTAYGMFVKSAPVLTHVDRGQKVIDFIKGFRRELMSSIRYGNYPFNHFCQDLHLTGGVEFGFQGYAIQEYLELEGEKAYAYQLDRGQSTSDLTCIIYLRNGQYDIRLSSSDALNSREDLKRLAKAIRATTENMMAQPEEVLAHLSMMDAEDAKTVQAFRFTAKADVPWKLFYQPIEQNAIRYADRKALVAKDRTLTFAELNTEANRVAHALMRRGLKQGDRVVLLLPRTSAVIVSMFGVSKAGAAYIPCDPAYPSDRINLIVNDSEAPYIITTQNLASDYPAEKVILVEEIYGPQSQPQPGDEENPNLNVSPDDLAYLIYTSGSTGRPKGVMLRHVGITNYLYDHPANVHIHGLTQLGVKTFVSITTLSFDMSLKEFAGSLFNGITSVLADELEVLDASLLADLMNRTGAEAINGTCSRMLSYMELPAFCEALSHCKAVWSGGEKYPMQLLTSLQSMGVHIFNTYGPTEITVSSNIADLTHARKVTVGHPLLNYEEFIVDPWGNQLPVGFTGELLIGGPGVARGYNNLPEMTAERFVEYAGIRVYRSGDLARWEPDGDVEILGRNDGQVKLRGFRIELGEVENLSVKFPGIRQTVADVKDIGTTQHLCLYYVSDDTVDEDALKTFIASSLTEYMVPSVYMRIDAIPLTPNGKTNRKALPVPTLKLDEVVAPATPMEQSILQLVYDLLQLSDFGVTNDLIALGLSSLASMRLSATLKKQLGVQVLMKDIMKHPTVREIAAMAEGSKETITLQSYERREWYPLNESQRGMYVDWMMNPDALQYNIPILLHFRGIDEHQVKDSLIAVANAHPYMKVRLAIKGDDVVQLRQDDATVEVTIEQLDHMPDRLWFQTHVKPFDLLNEPLYRFNIFTYADHVFLLLDLHHIISDGSSNYVIAKELEKAYRGEVLTPETYTAYDRALDEEALMKSERKQEAEDYFDALVGGLEATVYPHSSKTDGERKQGVVDVYVTSTDIDAFCKKQALPTSSFFLAVFHQVLERITREESTLVYFISNGRSELLLDNFFGVLVKTLPSACSQFKGQMADVVRGLNTQMQETIRNDFYPFTKLVERHDLKAEILYNYFVDLQTEVCLGGHQSEEIYGLDWDMAKTPLSITMLRADDGVGYTARIEYDATLYSRQDMEVLGNSFKAFAESCCTAAGNEIANCRIVLPEEYDQLIQLSKGKTMPVDPNETFVSIFMEQAAKTPDAMAVIDEDNSGQSQSAGYTYRQLDQLSNALATELRSLGVGDENTPSPFVSIMLGYEKAFLVAAIGVEKAGGAYVPLDYEYPNDRLLYMLEDSESQVLITSHAIFNEKSSEGDNFTAKNILFIDDFLSSVQGSGFRVNDSQANHEPLTMNHEPVNFATPDRLAYMIYTSGSTGKPKGVMIPHRAKANFVRFIAKEWHHTAQSRICCHSSFSFDASIEDLYPVLTVGGTLYTVPKEARKDLVMLYDFIIKNKITGGCYTTQLGLMLLQQFPDLPVDYLVVGGEKMADNPDCQCRLINTYGPTEFTVDATFYETEHGRDYKNIPIGRPLYNLSAFVTDPTGNLVPQGVPGELCMAGPQIARGYWKREDLTAEKFVDCPFMEGKMYHTGDLVKYNSEGQIEYMGRIDNQVKLRGFRIELGEIETLISKYDGIRMQSVQVKEMGGVQHLCAYYTADRPIDTNALRDYLAEQLTDYMVPTAYMQLDEMPLTPNGKVNTKALPNPSAQTEELVAPVTKTEKELFKLTAEMLKHDKFGITSNLISMGLTSLTAMRFTVGVFNTFGVQVSVKEVMQHSTIHQMAALIDAKREEEGLTTPTSDSQFWAEGKHYYYPITENQRGVFFDWEMNRDTTQYNVPDVVVMKDADPAKLRDALEKVVNAHPYLKTRFVQHDGDVMQIRRDEEPVEILMESLAEEPDTSFFQNRVRPFDLYNDTLYRLEIYTYNSKVYLFMDIHHSIYDGASSLIFLNDIQKAYEGENITPETYTAFDFALDELRLMRSEQYEEAGDYFKKLLSNADTIVYPQSVKQAENDPGMLSKLFKGENIESFCQQNGLTLNSYFLAITMHVLHTVTQEDDIIITTINNGRSDVRMMNIMGMFVKTIPVVSSSADSHKPVAEVVKLLQDQLLETQSRDFYPFTKMVELYGLRPEIMYAYQPKDVSQDAEQEDQMRLMLDQTKLPLDIQVMPDKDGFVLELQYDTALYAKQDMEQLAALMVDMAEQAPSMSSLQDLPQGNLDFVGRLDKVVRKKVSAPKVDAGQIVEAGSETEAQMLAIAEELLGGERIGVTTNLITAGLTSLSAMRLSAVIKQKTQFYIPTKDILLHPTIREMATLVGATHEEEPKTYAKLDYYPITENQRGVYIDWEMNHEALQYNIPEVIPMDAYSPEQIHDALVKVMDAHPYLKVHLLMKDNDILQQRRDDAPVVITTTQLNHEPDKTDFEQRVKPFNLLGEDLYRLEIIQSPSKCYLFVDIHHIVNDGVSRLIFSEDLQRALKQETLTPEGSTAYDYALEEKRLLEGEQFKAAEAYFDNMLSGQDSTVYPHSAEPTDARGLGYDQFTIPYTDIDAFCRQSGVTPHAYFATMLSQLLHRVTREENVVFTTIDNGRSDAHWAQSIGMYVKTLPVASTQNMQEIDHVTIADAVKQMHQQLMTTRSYSFYPFTSMVERHHIRPEIMFVYHGNFAPPTSEEAPTDNIVLDLDTAKLPLTVTVYSKGEDYYQVSLEYDLALYSAASMKVLAGMMTAACQSVSESSKLTDIKLMTDAEQEAMVKYSKGKDMDVDITKTFAQVFEERAKLVPDNIAVADKDSHLTYQQLSHYSDVLAHQLIKAGVQPNNFVCVMLDRYKEFPLSVLAIHKAGAAYTPMDFEYPNERLQYMLENSESKVLITTHTVLESKLLEGNFDTGKAQVIFIDDVDFSVQAEPINLTTPDNLAYMIYTSGSTGKPKGAMLHQAGLWNFINIVIDMEKLTANDRIEGHRSFSFDAHIEDMYAILTLGGSFHIMPSEIRKDLSAIRDFLFEHKITGGGYSTAIAALLLNTYDDMPVRFITAGGEKLDGVYSDHIEIINVYGPTECTDDTSYYSIAPGTHAENIPIGKPVANTWNFIVDTTGHLVPRGMVGELCIAGIQVGRGYWRLPERSAQSFVDCPFVGVDRWGRKVHMYHTGDLCRYNENGDLEYMGRIDFQVKLRGFRIELGEIESKVLQMEGVKQAAAEVRKVNDVDHLLLYYTLDNGSALTDDDIRQALESSSLADYMVPDTYMQLDEMPMTPNGKVNRKALPEPVIRRAAEYVEPQNETERVVAQAMQEVLGLQQEVGALDNFFTWGGDSIKCIRLVSRLRSEGITLQVADIMKLKVVRDIAAVCSNGVVEISQDAWSGEVPQTAITSMFFDLKLPKPHHYNQTFFIRAAERVKPEALKQTMAALVNHHDMLRAIVLNNQLFVRDAEEPNLYGWEQMDCTKDADYRENIEAVCRLQQKSVNLANGPLFKVVLFNTPDYDAILMVCHHLVVDGVSWRILLEDFNTAYAQAVENIPIELPAKTHSFREYAETLQEYAHSYNLSQERTYWDAVQKKLLRLPASNDKDNSRMMKDVRSTLDEQTTHSIMTTAGDAYHADINDLLMTALGRSYFKLTGEKAVSVQFEGHGREYIGSDTLMTDRTVGWFTSIYPVVLEHLDGDMRSCLRQTKETMHRVPNKGVGYNVLRYLSVDIPVYNTELCALIGFNYLGDMTEQAADGHKPFTAMTEISAGDDISPKNVFGPDLNINCSVVEGKLEATMAFNKALCSEEQARRLLDGMMEELREITIHTTAVKDVEVTATDLGEYEWTDEEFQSVYDHFKGMGTPLQRIYPLSPMQEGMALKFMLEPNSLAYRLLMRMSLDILPTEEQLRYTLDQLGAKHEVLRTSLIYRGVEQYRQAIVDRPLELEMRDVTGAANKESAMVALYRAEQQKGFDMEDQSLFRIICVKTSETTSEILLAVHHIIVDGWCIGLYMSDLIANLTDAVEGRMKPIGQYPTGRYEKFIRELLRKDTDRGLKYWRELLDGYTTKAVIPSAGIVPEQERAADNVCRITIGGNEMTALKALTARAQATMNTLVELAWGLVLQVYNRQDDVVFVKVVSGRNNASEGVEDVVGLFINSVPVRVRTPKGTTVIEALEMLQHQAAETNEWDFCPLSAIQQQTDLGADLFQSIVAFENYDSGVESKNASAPFHAKMIYAKEESINDLTITAYTEDDSELIVNLEFDPMKYRKSEIEQVKNVMRQMLQNMAQSPEADVSSFPPLSKKDCIALVKLGMGETLNYDTKQTLVDLFTEQARKTPESTCIVFQDKRLTYREVDTMTDRLAVLLQKRYHVQPEMAVGVMIERSELMLIYPMAIMKAGAAYMPLDFHFPAERLSFMCKDAGVKLILSEGNRVAEAMPDYKGKVVTSDVLERLDEVKGVLNQKKARPENMFVILYTSGSTGTPKGVVLEHRNIVNFCHWYVDAFKVAAQDRAVAYANFGFDAHMMDLYPVISVGGSVYIIPSDMRMDLMAMNAYMEQEQLNLAFMTTQVGYMFATTIENKSLRLLSVGGEKLQPLAKPAFDFYNGYGPTECTLYSTFYHIDRDYDSSYIGRPLAGYQLYVVDPNMNLVPQGAMGELVVAGAGVGRGYLNRPDQNAEKFITFMGQKAYRTGDLVKWSPDGNIDFIGRIDGQVKLRGLRIEMGEIEACVLKYSHIKTTAVDVKEICGAQHICCYFTADEQIDVESLKEFLTGKLADYMVPTAYMQMEKLPLTPNGKVNRRALPVPTITLQTENVPPRTEKEQVLFDIAKELLKLDDFGVTDDLTKLGLTSLLAIKMVMMATKRNLSIKLDDLMKLKTIRATLQHEMTMLSWVTPYKESKPVVVLVCGATPYKDMEPYVELLSKHYSVLVFEPIGEHYDYIFQDDNINEVVEMYYALLDLTLPRGVKVSAFTGHCFGGEIAYRMAIKWEHDTGDTVPMVMLDVFWRVDPLHFDEEALMKMLPQPLIDKYGNAIRSYAKAMHMYDKLGRQGVPPLYHGDVVLFRATEAEPDSPILVEIYDAAPQFKDAWKSVNSERSMDNAAFWRQYYPNMEIHNMQAHHMSMLEGRYAQTYVEWLDNYLKNHQSSK